MCVHLLFVYVCAWCDKYVVSADVCVCMPPKLRCTVGNERIKSREQINLPKDNEIISHLQLLDEERKQWRCVCECEKKRERERKRERALLHARY